MKKPRKYKRGRIEKCSYCDGKGVCFNVGQPKFKLRLIDNFNGEISLHVKYDDYVNLITPIYYCPICGRNLNNG